MIEYQWEQGRCVRAVPVKTRRPKHRKGRFSRGRWLVLASCTDFIPIPHARDEFYTPTTPGVLRCRVTISNTQESV